MIKRLLKNSWIRVILIIHLVLILGGIILFFYIGHISKIEFDKASKNQVYDAIIIPGYPFREEGWHKIMKIRVHWSKYLYNKGMTKNIIYSGGAVYSPYIESEIMKLFALEMDLPKSNLYTETRAEHSTENLYYSILLAKMLGFKKLALATDPFQSFFLMKFAESEGFEIDFLPIQYDLIKDQKFYDPIIDPSLAYVDNFVPLPERQNFFERFKGTLGWKIKR